MLLELWLFYIISAFFRLLSSALYPHLLFLLTVFSSSVIFSLYSDSNWIVLPTNDNSNSNALNTEKRYHQYQQVISVCTLVVFPFTVLQIQTMLVCVQLYIVTSPPTQCAESTEWKKSIDWNSFSNEHANMKEDDEKAIYQWTALHVHN